MSEIKRRIVYLLKRTDKRDDGTDIYVGNTSLVLSERLRLHRKDSTRLGYENTRLYVKMREVGLDNWEVLPLLVLTCDRKTILGFEKEWSKALNVDLNTYSAINTEQENRESIIKRQANYYRLNREILRQKQANYYDSNRETILQKKMQLYHKTIQNKVYHCDVCDKSFQSNYRYKLQNHFDSSKHKYAHLYSWVVTL